MGSAHLASSLRCSRSQEQPVCCGRGVLVCMQQDRLQRGLRDDIPARHPPSRQGSFRGGVLRNHPVFARADGDALNRPDVRPGGSERPTTRAWDTTDPVRAPRFAPFRSFRAPPQIGDHRIVLRNRRFVGVASGIVLQPTFYSASRNALLPNVTILRVPFVNAMSLISANQRRFG